MNRHRAVKDIQNWGISRSVIRVLLDDINWLEWLKIQRSKKPFPANYRPQTIEVFYNDICQLRAIEGQITYFKPFRADTIPSSIEIRFDQEIAMLLIQGEIVIDRTNNNIYLDRLLDNIILCPMDWDTNLQLAEGNASTPTTIAVDRNCGDRDR